MKKTQLNKIHKKLGAKMSKFAGYEMPILYKSINYEHINVRKNIGVFDVSHMGEFFIEGPKAYGLLQKICSNDISKLSPGKAQYNYMPNLSGGVVDDLILYQLENERYLMVVNASNIHKDWEWIKNINKNFNADLKDESNSYGLLSVQGPKAIEAMQKLTLFDLSSFNYYEHRTINFANIDNVIVSKTGYTGSGGLELCAKNSNLENLWHNVIKVGKDFEIEPIGLAARDTLRLEMGYCLYGNELNENTSPIEAGLGWITKNQFNFINSNFLKKEIFKKSINKLIGFKLIEKGIPRKDYKIFNLKEQLIGKVTSGTHSPTLGIGIGMGYIKTSELKDTNTILIGIRNKLIKAQISKVPFI